MLTPTLTNCQLPHAFCLTCLLEVTKENSYGQRSGKCPLCRFPISKNELTLIKVGSHEQAGATHEDAAEADAMEADDLAVHSSTKLDALMEVLAENTEEHPKTVVFTAFCSTQGLVAAHLLHEGTRFVEIRAGASQAQRSNALKSFTTDPEVTVFLLPLKAAAVGLTLTCANRLILLEPGINLAEEAQAIGRVHRFGQERPVSVIKFACRDTIEEAILKDIHGEHGSVVAAGGGAVFAAGCACSKWKVLLRAKT